MDPSELSPCLSIGTRYFYSRCRANMRMIIIMDPDTALFARRLIEHPQLVSFCNCSHVSQWNSQSISDVATLVLSKSPLFGAGGRYHEFLGRVASACIGIHETMMEMAKVHRQFHGYYQARREH